MIKKALIRSALGQFLETSFSRTAMSKKLQDYDKLLIDHG